MDYVWELKCVLLEKFQDKERSVYIEVWRMMLCFQGLCIVSFQVSMKAMRESDYCCKIAELSQVLAA
jgi:hypothetical protein